MSKNNYSLEYPYSPEYPYYEIMQKNARKFKLSNASTCFNPDIESLDGTIQIKKFRIGGGYSMGINYYSLIIDGVKTNYDNLETVYKKIVEIMGLS